METINLRNYLARARICFGLVCLPVHAFVWREDARANMHRQTETQSDIF